MNVTGYRRRAFADGIDLLERREVRIPLEEILREKIGPLAGGDLFRAASGDLRNPPAPGRLECPRLFGTVTGYLVYDSLRALAAFLSRHQVRTGMEKIDPIVGSAGRNRARALREALADLTADPPRHERWGRHRRRGGICAPFVPASFLRDLVEYEAITPVTLEGAVWFFPRCGKSIELAVEDRVLLSGHPVPRRRFVCVALGRDARWENTEDYHIVSFDGRGVRASRSLCEIPADLMGDLEERGFLCDDRSADILPCLDLEPVAVLCVPPAKEIATRLRRDPGDPPLAGSGHFVCDTAWPIAVPEDTPVFDRPDEVLAVLARVREGVFVRGEPPRISRGWVREEPYYVTVNRVRA